MNYKMAPRKKTEVSDDVVDTIASSSSSKEIVDSIKNAMFNKALQKLEKKKAEIANKAFFPQNGEEMKYVEAPLNPYKNSAEADRQNDDLLATGENAAGNIEPEAYPGALPQSAGMGWMNPLGVPQRTYGGNRTRGQGFGAGV